MQKRFVAIVLGGVVILGIQTLSPKSTVMAAEQQSSEGAAAEGAVAEGSVSIHTDEQGWRLVVDGATVRETDAEIVAPRFIAIPDSETRVLLWSEDDGLSELPWYAISLDGRSFKRPRRAQYEITMKAGRFDPLSVVPAPPSALVADADNQLHLVQFVTQPLDAYRASLESLGATVLKFIPHAAMLVSIPHGVEGVVSELPFVRVVLPFHPAYRVEPFLLENWSRLDEVLPRQRYLIRVVERGARLKSIAADRITAMGGRIDVNNPSGFLLEATLTPNQLSAVIRWNEVEYVDRWTPIGEDMNIAREFGGANYVETLEGFTGNGVRGEVMDGNVLWQHQDLVSRPFTLHGPASGSDSHGTGTTGIVFGDGSGNNQWRGMLPNGQPLFADNAGFGEGGSGDRYELTAELSQPPYFAVFQSNSWGFVQTTQYTNASSDFDDILFLNDIIICQSQSNTGNQQSRPQAWAKNVVAVGGVYHEETLTMADDHWNGGFGGSASIGPAADGRVKPDLVHFYDGLTTLSDGGGYGGFCCTSGATPVVAGHFGIFFEMWHNGVFNNPHRGTVFDSRPHMATSKAMLINTARHYAFSGTSADLRRTHQGWGIPDLRNLYDMRNNMVIVDESDVLTNLDSTTYELTVPPGEPEFRATLVFADPAGSPVSAIHRINDLTLRVTSPGGTIYYGNNGLLAGNWSTPDGQPNTIDTVENVFVEDPEPGVWTVEVLADEIVEDSHLETPGIDADYGLVVSGVASQMDPYSYFDADADGDVDSRDFGEYLDCVTGPAPGGSLSDLCRRADCDGDNDVDLADYGCFARTFTSGCGTTIVSATRDEVFSCLQSTAVFEVVAEGDNLQYQWFKDGNAISGATNPTYVINSVAGSSAGLYHAFVWSDCGMTDTPLSRLLVSVAPDITESPEDAIVCEGEEVILECDADGAEPLTYHWRRNGVDIPGSEGQTYVIESATAEDLGSYRCVVTDDCDLEVESDAAQLVTVNVDITTSPEGAELCVGELLFLTVKVSGFAESYQWFKDGEPVEGATDLFLLISAVTPDDAGDYTVEVSGPCDSVLSEPATVLIQEDDCP